ncbi:MAG: CheR family methyltransferase [Beijerinckiaceae bacterium]
MMSYDFDFFRDFLRARSGLSLTVEKKYLLESRLIKVMQARAIANLSQLASQLRNGWDAGLERDVVEAMTTNETLFFRDKSPFEALERMVLPRLMQSRAATRRLSIWCAACACGQEPYSLAMMLEDNREMFAGWTISILATDLSSAMIEKAKAGVYSQFEVQRGLPVRHLLKYFTQEKSGWALNAAIRNRVQFRTLNLMQDFSGIGQFDVILCRNVLIYFDLETRRDVLGRLKRQLASDGRLVLGAPETVIGVTRDFAPDPDAHGLYTPVHDPVPGVRLRA